jgi:hypothetical protein
MITALNKDKLLLHIKKKGFSAEHQPETDQISVMLNIDGNDFPLFIRILPQGPVLQLLVFIPCQLQAKSLPDLARLLHLLNKEMDVPGFGLDETANVVFYRVTIPALNNKIDMTLFDTYISSIQLICRSFTPVISNVSQGIMTFASVLQKAKESHQTNQ